MNTTNSKTRETKKVTIDVWADSEASFYLALHKLKTSLNLNPGDIQMLVDSICYRTNSEDENRKIFDNISCCLSFSWTYIYKASKDFDLGYHKVSLDSFSEFGQSEFGLALRNQYYHFRNLLIVAKNGENLMTNTHLSIMSILKASDTNPNIVVSKKVIGSYFRPIFNSLKKVKMREGNNKVLSLVYDNQNLDVEMYVATKDKLKKIGIVEVLEIQTDKKIYFKSEDKIIEVTFKDGSMCFTPLIGAVIEDEQLDVSVAKEETSFVIPFYSINEPKFTESKAVEVEIPNIEEAEEVVEVKHDIEIRNNDPIEINKVLEKFYHIPRNAKNQAYSRNQIVTTLYQEIQRFYPEISHHIKTAIIGYLSIPFGLVDTEEKHNISKRAGNHHAYVGKTIRNLLKSKPFS